MDKQKSYSWPAVFTYLLAPPLGIPCNFSPSECNMVFVSRRGPLGRGFVGVPLLIRKTTRACPTPVKTALCSQLLMLFQTTLWDYPPPPSHLLTPTYSFVYSALLCIFQTSNNLLSALFVWWINEYYFVLLEIHPLELLFVGLKSSTVGTTPS